MQLSSLCDTEFYSSLKDNLIFTKEPRKFYYKTVKNVFDIIMLLKFVLVNQNLNIILYINKLLCKPLLSLIIFIIFFHIFLNVNVYINQIINAFRR